MPTKTILKEEILQEITENFMEKILGMVNQNIQDSLKKLQETKNKEHEKTQKQINELMASQVNTKVKQRTL
jgi:methionyl-tRNA synthetase